MRLWSFAWSIRWNASPALGRSVCQMRTEMLKKPSSWKMGTPHPCSGSTLMMLHLMTILPILFVESDGDGYTVQICVKGGLFRNDAAFYAIQ
jgi:hypothetical protein